MGTKDAGNRTLSTTLLSLDLNSDESTAQLTIGFQPKENPIRGFQPFPRFLIHEALDGEFVLPQINHFRKWDKRGW
jgi:hypothetical protein